jgi:hypothetical protein
MVNKRAWVFWVRLHKSKCKRRSRSLRDDSQKGKGKSEDEGKCNGIVNCVWSGLGLEGFDYGEEVGGDGAGFGDGVGDGDAGDLSAFEDY